MFKLMRYINSRFSHLLTCLLTYLEKHKLRNIERPCVDCG